MPLYCHYAVASASGAVEREGVAALSELAEQVKRAQRVVLLLAASDVTLLRVKMPPLSGAKLRAALPNLVEDRLMSDPEECVVVAGDMHAGLRTVAVVGRNWLELLIRTLRSLGARNISAVPSQLCLPYQGDTASAAVSEHGPEADLAVRVAEQDGLGLSIIADQPESLAFEAMQSLAAVVPAAPIALYVPQSRVRDYQESLHVAPTLEQRITLHADSWQRWVAGAGKAGVDLIAGMGSGAGPQFDWKPWRWPLVIGAAVLLVNVIGLNVDWLRLKREASALSNGMVQTYRAAFPKDPVIIDPLAQLRQKMAGAQRDSGQLAPDDFLALASAFSEAWASTGQGPAPVASLEYRDRSLTVKLKPGTSASMEQLKTALSSRNLSLTQSTAGVWQIRSGK
ncbi:general secretion pathway protein GspL [Noviherbaspirillum denitrificans]|uniref:General secretion pathway protein GspL n=1 Tax=Noviherbaspirillum denitrificans TaxID=1968433 RepID=A0A254TJ85_9BURK|nr:general secretion pathway protein GspL [Noviherbaspirillum denitrificans]